MSKNHFKSNRRKSIVRKVKDIMCVVGRSIINVETPYEHQFGTVMNILSELLHMKYERLK